jgi:hypothetical protein
MMANGDVGQDQAVNFILSVYQIAGYVTPIPQIGTRDFDTEIDK